MCIHTVETKTDVPTGIQWNITATPTVSVSTLHILVCVRTYLLVLHSLRTSFSLAFLMFSTENTYTYEYLSMQPRICSENTDRTNMVWKYMVEAHYYALVNWMGRFVSNLCRRRNQIDRMNEQAHVTEMFWIFDIFYYANSSKVPPHSHLRKTNNVQYWRRQL